MSTTLDTTMTRTQDGLGAKTTIALGACRDSDGGEAQRILEISTRKRLNRGIISSAYCYVEDAKGMQTFELFGDFRVHAVVPRHSLRATEKNIRIVHALALEHAERLVAEAQAFYARKAVPEIVF